MADITTSLVVSAKEVGLEEVQAKLKGMVGDLNKFAGKANIGMKELNASYDVQSQKLRVTSRSMHRFKMELLSVMFFGMALSRLWQEHTQELEKMFGLTDMNAAAMQYLLLPAYEEWANVMMEVNDWIFNLDEGTRLWIGRIMLLVQAGGNMLFMFGQMALGIDGITRVIDKLKVAGGGSVLLGIANTLKNLVKGAYNIVVNFLMGGWSLLKSTLTFLWSWISRGWNVFVNFLMSALNISKVKATKLALASTITVGLVIALLNIDWIKEQLAGLWRFGEERRLEMDLRGPTLRAAGEMERLGGITKETKQVIRKIIDDWVAVNMNLRVGVSYMDSQYTFLGLNANRLIANNEYILGFKNAQGEIVELTEEEWIMLKEIEKQQETSVKLNKLLKNQYDEQYDTLLNQGGAYDTIYDKVNKIARAFGKMPLLKGLGGILEGTPGFQQGDITTNMGSVIQKTQEYNELVNDQTSLVKQQVSELDEVKSAYSLVNQKTQETGNVLVSWVNNMIGTYKRMSDLHDIAGSVATSSVKVMDNALVTMFDAAGHCIMNLTSFSKAGDDAYYAAQALRLGKEAPRRGESPQNKRARLGINRKMSYAERHLASGGIVTSPTLALIGERGPEAVVPLDKAGGLPSVVNNYFNISVDKLSSDVDLNQLAYKISRLWKQEMTAGGLR